MNKEQLSLKTKENNERNKDNMRKRKQEHNKNNRDKIINYFNYYNNRRKNDPIFELTENLRKRTRAAFKTQNVSKNNKTFELFGCSQQFLRARIEFQLFEDIKIENYGVDFVLDHTVPIASFNLFNEDEVKKCFNWKNLRPMRPTENMSKGDKVDERLYLLQEIKAKHFKKIKW